MTPDGAVKLGRSMYLFLSTTDSHNCVVDAHGGFFFENRSFTVPAGVTLYFYSDHGSSVTDPGQGAIKLARNHSQKICREKISGGQSCHNYILSKAWGDHLFKSDDHGKAITYKIAKDMLDQQDDYRNKKVLEVRQRLMRGGDAQFVDYDEDTRNRQNASLLTVRNRPDYTGVTLKDAITQARLQRNTLNVFHCNFCRGPIFPGWIAEMLNQTKGPSQDLEFK
jgi:hypothetical protein